jgi:hypothetical protein
MHDTEGGMTGFGFSDCEELAQQQGFAMDNKVCTVAEQNNFYGLKIVHVIQ